MKRSFILLGLLCATASVAQTNPAATATVKPGDDFDDYVNGAWRAKAEIPADRSSTGVDYDVFKVAEARNAAIIKGAGATTAAGADGRKIADYYAAYVDTAGIEARGLRPLKPQLDAIAALKDRRALSAALGASMRSDTDPLNASNFFPRGICSGCS